MKIQVKTPLTKAENTELALQEFNKIIYDFSKDILKTYPELKDSFTEDLNHILEKKEDKELLQRVYDYCQQIYPERFFDILYQNEEIFEDAEINTHFLPNIDFKLLWKENISDNTRQSIWKYLQLILFTIVSSLSKEESFGDTAKLFEAINQDEFKQKLEETIKGMHEMFEDKVGKDGSGDGAGGEDNKEGGSADGEDNTKSQHMPNMPNMPNPEELHETCKWYDGG